MEPISHQQSARASFGCQEERCPVAACRSVGYNIVANLGLSVTMRGLHVDSTLQQAVVPLLLENNFQSPPQDVPKRENKCKMLVFTPQSRIGQCFSTFVRPRSGKFFFYKTRARSQQIIGLHTIFMTGHKQRYSLSRMLKDLDV
jgi:hypothetical protein